DLEAPPALAAVAHAATDPGDEVARRVEAYEQADRQAASGFNDLISSAFAAVSKAVTMVGRVVDAASKLTPAVGSKAHWQNAAMQRAGIDRADWQPSEGIGHNRATIEKVYDYYGGLYLEHPGLEWLGLAAIAGPFFYAGWQHEAFVSGGIAEMRRQRAAGNIDAATLQAWEDIASGDPGRISEGTAGLIQREQYTVIQNEYQMLDHHGPVGEGFTLAITWIAANPIPGGKSYLDFSHHDIGVDLPAPGVDLPDLGFWDMPKIGVDLPKIGVDLPKLSIEVPKGNVADFEDRMAWITEDVVPAYEQFIHSQPDEVARILDTPVAERADGFRKFGG
ncbi:MAG: hypothetical protein ACRDV9_03135, partial [Acidimicrobiia bacterium]